MTKKAILLLFFIFDLKTAIQRDDFQGNVIDAPRNDSSQILKTPLDERILKFLRISHFDHDDVIKELLLKRLSIGHFIAPLHDYFDVSVTSLNDFNSIDHNIIKTLDNTKNKIVKRITIRNEIIARYQSDETYFDFVNFLILEKLLQPSVSFDLDQSDVVSENFELIDIITTFIQTKNIVVPSHYTEKFDANITKIMSWVTEGPLKMQIDTTKFKNTNTLLTNIKEFQRAVFIQDPDKAIRESGRHRGPVTITGHITDEEQVLALFTVMIFLFDAFTRNANNQEKKDRFIWIANQYYLHCPEAFEKIKLFLKENIDNFIRISQNTNDQKTIASESSKIMNKITKKPWQFWK